MFTFDFRDVSFAHKNGFTSSPRDEFHKHMHHFYEVVYFEKGIVEFHVEGISKKLEPGDVVLIRPGQFHFAEVDRKSEYQRYVCKLPEEAIYPFLVEKLNKMESFFPACQELLPILEELDRYEPMFRNEPDSMRALCVSKIIEFMVNLCHKESLHIEPEQESIGRALANYVEEHLNERITLESLAQAFHYSQSYIASNFRKEMHVSIISYVRGKKVMAAHSLILHGVKPSDAATMMGFTDYSTFFRCYQKMVGISPSLAKRAEDLP